MSDPTDPGRPGEPRPSYPPPNPQGHLPPQVPYPAPWEPGATAAPSTPVLPPRAKLPAWLLPAVALLALVLGIAGGAIGAMIVNNRDGGVAAHDVISVQKREAAPLPANNGSIAAVAQKVLPSTVQIVAEYDGKPQGATGSGFVLDAKGHIITNNHVVAQADQDHGPIEIIDQDGNRSKAKVIGRSTVYDLAVLDAPKTKSLHPVSLGSAQQMRVGETVVAIGSPLGLSATVTSGIVSAVDRPVTTGDGQSDNSYINALQTDAAINPGNSGGPLVNLQGQVVGVNSAIASLGSQTANDQGGNIGVGFAIPIEQVQVTASQILSTGRAEYPVIGADVRGTSALDGAKVESVTPGEPAAAAHLQVGDIIRKVDGRPVTGSIDVVVAIRAHTPGEKVSLTVQRGSKTFTVSVGLKAKTG
ncbi:MAG: trypsin-like peptidase domain-containing protein [Marmoricola sp.]|nr:trypsin-like peptidase domain-containing protein [Marmoricola sp.]